MARIRSITVHPALLGAVREFAEEYSLELLAQRLGVPQSRVSWLLSGRPLTGTEHQRKTLVRIARIVGPYLGSSEARRKPWHEANETEREAA